MLYMCDPLSSCINVHYTCAFCRAEVPRDVLRSSALFGSNAWCRKTSELWEKQCIDVIRDRINLEDMLHDAMSALTHSPLQLVTPDRRHEIVINARDSHRFAAEFLMAYDGYMTFRSLQPTFETEQEARETFARLAGSWRAR